MTSAKTILALLHCNSLNGGGTVRSHLEMVEMLTAYGYKTYTIMPAYDDSNKKAVRAYRELLENAGSTTFYVENLKPWLNSNGNTTSRASIPQIKTLTSEKIDDIINSVSPMVCITQTGVFPQLALSCLKFNIKHIWYVREYADLDYSFNVIEDTGVMGLLYNSLSDHVIYNSDSVRQHYERFNEVRYSSSVIPPWPRNSSLIRSRVSSSASDKGLRFSILGALVKGKNHEEVIRSFSMIKNLAPQNITLSVYGEGPERDRLLEVINHLSLGSVVRLHGHQSDIRAVYASTDVLIMASLHEAFGRTPIEAAWNGIPSICAKTSGVAEYIKHGENGWIFDPNDSSSIGSIVKDIVDNTNIISRVGARAMQTLGSSSQSERNFQNLLTCIRTIKSDKRENVDPLLRATRSLVKQIISSNSYSNSFIDRLRRYVKSVYLQSIIRSAV